MDTSDILVAFDIIFAAIDITMIKELVKNLLYARKENAVFLFESGQRKRLAVQSFIILAMSAAFALKMHEIFSAFEGAMYILLVSLIALWYVLSVNCAFVTPTEIITRKRRIKADSTAYALTDTELLIYDKLSGCIRLKAGNRQTERVREILGDNYVKIDAPLILDE
ncbi:MAG: hypothetical protein NC120_11895 [Ruminococcus sp.]|nr:hypothetical protein [Ruminococcus sp.]